jgi:hypothetical protein
MGVALTHVSPMDHSAVERSRFMKAVQFAEYRFGIRSPS